MNIVPNVKCASNYATKAKNCVKKNFAPALLGVALGLTCAHAIGKALGAEETIPEEIYNAATERYDTYKELADNGVDVLPYLGNYGKAQVLRDSIRHRNYILSPQDIEQALNEAELNNIRMSKEDLQMSI